MKVGLPLIKNVLKPLAKSILILLGLTTSASAVAADAQEIIFWNWDNNIDNFKQRNRRYHENS